ncbi:SOUL family heme-binding protein [Aurantiacibacter marinus]|uniref:Heme-binding protein n=1 Tax=Aurantiacibacter marinus TaxID=874156 RepID=A0A0H0XMG7_9SPHN|nr:heme-binding protein [Aurantiacibacter marinus]KLI63211.1 hypothetical protein AAV99_11070 [Aurantiacibacter marinus]
MIKKLALAAAGIGVMALGSAAALAQYEQRTEEPDFTAIVEDGDFALREYPSIVVAEVWHTGTRERASSAGFRRLAAYIFAQDRGGEAIAMTAPVIQDAPEQIAMTAPVMQDEGEAGRWRTRFVMPAEYTLETLPPAPDDITLTEIPARRMAVIRFSGWGQTLALTQKEAELRAWMADRDLTAAGNAEYAFYNSPAVPGPMRRNEVMIPVG